MSQKYSEEYYSLKAELEQLREQLSAYENAGGRAQKFLKLTERHAAFTELTPAILNEFISRIEVHERDQKRARYAIQHISILQFVKTLPSDEGRQRQAALLAFAAFSELKHIFLVDEDVDIFDTNDVLWAMTTRYQGDVDTVMLPGVRCHPLDPSATPAY